MQEISDLKQWNPPPLKIDTSIRHSNASLPLILSPRRTYLDKHIHESRTLKRVLVVPDLLEYLVQGMTVDALPTLEPWDDFIAAPTSPVHKTEGMLGANCVADHYRWTTAICCKTVASTYLYPSMRGWFSLFNFQQVKENMEPRALQEDWTLQIRVPEKGISVPRKARDYGLTAKEINTLRRVAQRFPYLATWEILSMTEDSQCLIGGLGNSPMVFEHETCSAKGYSAPHRPASPTAVDAKETTLAKNFFKASEFEDKHPNAPFCRSKKPQSVHPDVTITVPSVEDLASLHRSRASVEAFLEHAWCQSVRQDTTIIIFHCGTFERIGVRHRGMQTLFLSKLIDVRKCKNPAYGELHVGLYMTMLKDAMDRAKQLDCHDEEEAVVSRKRQREEEEGIGHGRKRRKTVTRSMTRNKDVHPASTALEHSVDREMLFLTFNHSIYHSQAPASFTRESPALCDNTNISSRRSRSSRTRVARSQGKYPPQTYLSVSVTSDLSQDSGLVHKGVLSLITAKGASTSCDVVVKLAFSCEEQDRLRHEYNVYRHLVASNVTQGIPRVFGLFKDMEDGPLALVMSYDGPNLVDVYWTADFEGRVWVPPEIRGTLQNVLQNIHDAGVVHGDIRPENIVVEFDLDEEGDEDGEGKEEPRVTIVNLGRAIVGAGRRAKIREHERLSAMLQGQIAHPWPRPR